MQSAFKLGRDRCVLRGHTGPLLSQLDCEDPTRHARPDFYHNQENYNEDGVNLILFAFITSVIGPAYTQQSPTSRRACQWASYRTNNNNEPHQFDDRGGVGNLVGSGR